MTENISLEKTNSVPKKQMSENQTSTKPQRSCCLFERSSGNLVNLTYDSKALEEYYQECSLLHAVNKFRFSTIFSIIISIVWIIYFLKSLDHYICHVSILVSAVVIFAIILGLTFADAFFKKWHTWLYLFLGLFLSFYSIIAFFTNSPTVSLIFNLFLNIQTILLLYTMIPVRLWQAIAISTVLSVLFLILIAVHSGLVSWRLLTVLVLLEFVAHEVGLVHHLMSQARRRSTFLKLGQGAQLKREIRTEQKTKEEMIQSLMPVEVAHQVMNSKDGELEDENDTNTKKSGGKRRQSEKDDDSSDEEAVIINQRDQRRSTQLDNEIRDSLDNDIENISVHSEIPAQSTLVHFRKFHVNQLKNVSILFADIVGFTKMSSNKTAPHLVFLLNDLFGSFDKLCEVSGCEKIATLGDCYYCVCGCPKEVEDHAQRCVEMGRSMCKAIRQFDERHNEEVNMRVGVHTGMVICGIVGTHRFKFDVWSHDVTLANEMESSGEAGRVHISEETYECVKNIYEVDEGPLIPDIRKLKVLVEYFDEKTQSYAIKHEQDQANIKTYFIIRRYDEKQEVLLITDEDNRSKLITFAEPNTDNTTNVNGAVDNSAAVTDLMLPNSISKVQDQEALDIEMIANFKEEDTDQIRSFFEPPINYLTLNFKEPSMERRYHRNGLRPHKKNVTNITWSTLRVTPFINAVASCLFIIALIIACFVAFPSNDNYKFSSRIGFCIALVLIIIFNIIFVIPLIIDFVLLSNISRSFAKFYKLFFNWYLRNLYGLIILGMPSVLVLCHFDKCLFTEPHLGYRLAMGIMLIFMLGNCTLFTIYSSWTKSCIATIIVIAAITILFKFRSFHQYTANITTICPPYSSFLQSYKSDSTPFIINVNNSSPVSLWMMGNRFIDIEIVICLLLTLIFIWYLNRELDISFRASFNCDHQATMARRIMAQERKQADWLLENIIPSFVIEDIKTTKKYSKHMERVGVIFATIANFGDFYDEQFEGGREMLRVLNEIFADFENLLPNPKYKDVQKIKTIGACFMAASGLNPIERERNRKPDSHLHALMDFSVDLIQTLVAFNEQLFNFNFELKIGFNIGDVTAGVIGTTKLLYDIWGDTVNVASRMYSTGEKGKIQVTEGVAKQLESRYDFTYRAEVEVKGKGKMTTYLLVGKKGAKKENASPLKQ